MVYYYSSLGYFVLICACIFVTEKMVVWDWIFGA